MPLTVLSVAFPLAAVSPAAVGGAEQILSTLDAALVERGHRSLVVACEGSQAAGELLTFRLAEEGSPDKEKWWVAQQGCQAAIDRALQWWDVDLIHLHGMDFNRYRWPAETPALATLHLPLEWYGKDALLRARGRAQLVCVSQHQRRSGPPALRALPVVENGIALPKWSGTEDKAEFALALGRICPEKNFHEALEAGTRAGMPVWLAGQVFPYREHEEYFQAKIEPLLPAGGHRFLGPVAPEQKYDLLRRARCLLHPTLAPETASLVAMEAMAAGTPVIAYPSGALTELVEDGVTGYQVNGVEAMAEAIGRIGNLLPERCRERAERRFTRERMVDEYVDLYQTLIQKQEVERQYA